MADENPKRLGLPKFPTPDEEDERDQLAVLQQVLTLHPAALTQAELARELTRAGQWRAMSEDAVNRAVRDLAGSGLLHSPCEPGRILPTRAALRYYELSGGAE